MVDEESAETPKENIESSTTTDTPTDTVRYENGSCRASSPYRRSYVIIIEDSDFEVKGTKFWILQQSFHNLKKERETKIINGPEEAEYLCKIAKIKDRISLLDFQTDLQEKLLDVAGYIRYIYSHSNPTILQEVPPHLLETERIPDQSASVWIIIEPPHI
ncbi:hypothetical protein AYI70_g5613 [Smittium culicis]|uniref:Uncharacterized protein n=1 Tax=Smittium culicis TaxID=133412 RepID=A0A1R1XQ01_9FUNG|nr:hypothetical protein AYI70_g6428 [Smittium culicis]OMJ18021.1 hypothetical protein AYI70_g5613 [Smittium culicis]